MRHFEILAAAVLISAVVSCTKDSFPVEPKTVEFSSEIELPEGFENWPRTIYVFDKTKCVDIIDAVGASGMKVNVAAGYRVVAIAYSSADNLSLTPAEPGSEDFRYKVMAADFNKALPEIWYGATVSRGDGNLKISFSPLTSVFKLDFKDIPSDMDSLVFDLPVSYDTWYPGEQKAEVSIPGSQSKHVVVDTRGKSELELTMGIMPMLDADKRCCVPVNCYYKDRYTQGHLPFKRRVGEACEFNIRLSDACGQKFDSPFAVSYELSQIGGGSAIASGVDYLSQWEYSYEPIVLPKDTTAFYVRNGQKMQAGRSFAFQFGSNTFTFNDDVTDFHSQHTLDMIPVYAACGFDHARIPIDEGWCFFSNGEAKPNFKTEVKNVVDAVIAAGMRVIIDYHWMGSGITVMPSESGYDALPSEQEIRFRNTWRQLHELFKDYAPEDLAYEIVNESYCIYDWNLFLERSIHMMRSWGGNELRRVIVCPAESEGDDGVHFLVKMELPKDDPNLIATFHDYSPVWFCFYRTGFQGGESHFDRYQGPIHYPGRYVTDAELSDMQLNNPDWFESTMYFRNASYDKSMLYEEMKPAQEASKRLGVPVWLGEYGAGAHSPYPDRLRFYQDVCSILREFGISYSFWFEIGKTAGDYYPDPQIVKAMVPDAVIE